MGGGKIPGTFWGPISFHPKDHWSLKTGYFEDQNTPVFFKFKPFHWRVLGILRALNPGIPTTIKTMGVNITTIVYLRVLIIQIGSTIILMVVEAQG